MCSNTTQLLYRCHLAFDVCCKLYKRKIERKLFTEQILEQCHNRGSVLFAFCCSELDATISAVNLKLDLSTLAKYNATLVSALLV